MDADQIATAFHTRWHPANTSKTPHTSFDALAALQFLDQFEDLASPDDVDAIRCEVRDMYEQTAFNGQSSESLSSRIKQAARARNPSKRSTSEASLSVDDLLNMMTILPDPAIPEFPRLSKNVIDKALSKRVDETRVIARSGSLPRMKTFVPPMIMQQYQVTASRTAPGQEAPLKVNKSVQTDSPEKVKNESRPKRKNRHPSPDSENEDVEPLSKKPSFATFATARDVLAVEMEKTNTRKDSNDEDILETMTRTKSEANSIPAITKSKKFVPPLMNGDGAPTKKKAKDEPVDERLRNIEKRMLDMILNEVLEKAPTVSWDDIAGLEHSKLAIKEAVVWPMLRPDIFKGIRGPPKGLLLFGPPRTRIGKTLIGKCIASQVKATFLSISASSLTSKWIGEGEKMMRALFAVARVHQPSIIFVDEVDSLLTQRQDGENEATRRIKTEFLVQFDGMGCARSSSTEDRVLVVGATNRPSEIDEAARRRFRKKLYIPLPEAEGRRHIIRNLLKNQEHSLDEEQMQDIVARTEGYSGSDMDGLVREAALGPVREIIDIQNVELKDVRPVTFEDFIDALTQVKKSVAERELESYLKFDDEYGAKSGNSKTTTAL
ncbi:hypothetical protein SmJEL517_g02812 [Synchytrium microbalum]|uniref:AAA+ ATPase domain-containing protein n=1 Tax=Synchytrium microbalum TaxID=1806994 RepID=A0A507C5B4_9FUNG|nr:uncharacterized protein SmJEL517_g02812 [Synchytrium microbalum]TPX34568.1 hypothetical protein SmJEL517_g02812 [Synchytrium microbalum]